MSWFPVVRSSGESPSASCGGSSGSSVLCGEPPSGAPLSSGSSGRRHGQWWRAGWGALAVVVACGLVACSGGGGPASSVSVPPHTPDAQTASAGPSAAGPSVSSPAASGAPTAPGEVTAESLSDPDSDYVVVSIPEDLDETQGEVLVAYVAYDRATWRATRIMDGDHSAVEATATGQALKNYRDNYASLESEGLHASGVYRMKVLGVNNVSPDGAVMFICVDQHAMDALKADGTSSGRNVQHTYSYMVTLDRSSGSWMVVSDEQMGGADQC